eukprot:14236-Eustigmatos_ZCMA.PRE.1
MGTKSTRGVRAEPILLSRLSSVSKVQRRKVTYPSRRARKSFDILMLPGSHVLFLWKRGGAWAPSRFCKKLSAQSVGLVVLTGS